MFQERHFLPFHRPENLVLQLLRHMRADMGDMREKMATKDDLAEMGAELRSEMRSLRADVTSDLHALDSEIDVTRKELSDQIVGLRRSVVEYHSAVIGHGHLICDLEARIRRVEQRLGMESHS
jgi:signal transduction histidine kinase